VKALIRMTVPACKAAPSPTLGQVHVIPTVWPIVQLIPSTSYEILAAPYEMLVFVGFVVRHWVHMAST
jgi:hypothetical protein